MPVEITGGLRIDRHDLRSTRGGWYPNRTTRHLVITLKAPLHDAIRPHGACRLPCTWANQSVWHVARMSGHVQIGWKWITARSIFEPILLHELCCAITQSERSRHLKRPSPYTITNARRVGCNNAPKCTHPASKYFGICQQGILL